MTFTKQFIKLSKAQGIDYWKEVDSFQNNVTHLKLSKRAIYLIYFEELGNAYIEDREAKTSAYVNTPQEAVDIVNELLKN